jgi:hypothetical protein
MRAIAETIGAGLGVPVRRLTGDEAQAHFDWMAHFVAIDNPTSSAQPTGMAPPGTGAPDRHEGKRIFLVIGTVSWTQDPAQLLIVWETGSQRTALSAK